MDSFYNYSYIGVIKMDTIKTKKAIAEAWWYLEHYFGCEIDQTDFCTCGLREAKIELKKVYEEL